MRKYLSGLIEKIENSPFSFEGFLISFLALVFGRIAIEHFFINFRFQYADEYFYQFSHHFLTFLFIFLVVLFIITLVGKIAIEKAAAFLLTGFIIIWTPPIIDEILSRGDGFWSFYTFESLAGLGTRYLTFFGDKPEVGITYGIRVEIAIAVIATTLYVFLKSRSSIRTGMAAFLSYTGLFVIGSFPSFVTFVSESARKGLWNITENDIAALMLSPTSLFGLSPPSILSSLAVKMSTLYAVIDVFLLGLLLFFFYRRYFMALFQNARIPQMIYHGGLLLLGGLFAAVYGQTSFSFDIFHIAGLLVMIIAVECAWLASVIVNDFSDQNTDRITNPHRPLPSGSIPPSLYRTFGVLFFLASIFFAMILSTQAGLLLLAYQGLAWIYSAWPLRLKRFPGVATLLSALASLLIFFSGYIVFATEKNIEGLPSQIPLFLLVAYALIIPIKDFKDVAGDRADGVFTLPVILGELWAKRLLGSALFALFIGSVFLMNVKQLFLLAVFFGSLAYWLLHLSSPDHKYFSYRSLPAWFIALASAYGCFLLFSLL